MRSQTSAIVPWTQYGLTIVTTAVKHQVVDTDCYRITRQGERHFPLLLKELTWRVSESPYGI